MPPIQIRLDLDGDALESWILGNRGYSTFLPSSFPPPSRSQAIFVFPQKNLMPIQRRFVVHRTIHSPTGHIQIRDIALPPRPRFSKRLGKGRRKAGSHLQPLAFGYNIVRVHLDQSKFHIIQRATSEDPGKMVCPLTLCTTYPDPKGSMCHC